MAEKRKPTHDLAAFKLAFSTVDGLSMTTTAAISAVALGFDPQGVVDVIATMQRTHFYKSMTSHGDHRSWQDVYRVPNEAGLLYVKFRDDRVTEYRLLSFKEKDDG